MDRHKGDLYLWVPTVSDETKKTCNFQNERFPLVHNRLYLCFYKFSAQVCSYIDQSAQKLTQAQPRSRKLVCAQKYYLLVQVSTPSCKAVPECIYSPK